MNSLGKTLILFGILLTLFGLVIMLGGKLSWFGRLPGDIYVEKKGFSLYFPITTSILISIILSIVFILLRRR
ncbi:MAG: DUF2905 domain-containing protein [Candidatus Omnitrophica bacterium]|nr:DUF2905 domain-containing protein [Candidatus Omnitrophota bacterium]